MYKFERYCQLGLADFNQPVGLKMNLENRWVKKAATIPWDAIEEKYAGPFRGQTGMPAKPLRMALGSLMIQKQYGYSDRKLLEQITENPYYQFFIGLPGFQNEPPFVPSLLVDFRKRMDDEVMTQINEMTIAYNTPDFSRNKGIMADLKEPPTNKIDDYTCASESLNTCSLNPIKSVRSLTSESELPSGIVLYVLRFLL